MAVVDRTVGKNELPDVNSDPVPSPTSRALLAGLIKSESLVASRQLPLLTTMPTCLKETMTLYLLLTMLS